MKTPVDPVNVLRTAGQAERSIHKMKKKKAIIALGIGLIIVSPFIAYGLRPTLLSNVRIKNRIANEVGLV